MLNEQFFDKKDREILKLKHTIAAFKKYDNERKEYLKKLQWELEEVSQDYLDLKKTLPKDALAMAKECEERMHDLKACVKGQNKTISHLQKVIALMEDEDKLKRAEEVLKHCSLLQLKAMNDSLQKQVDSLRATNSELITRLVQLNRKENEDKG